MGVMLASAMGNTVTVISRSNNKEAMAKEMGAKNFIVSSDPASMGGNKDSLDLILDTISAHHKLSDYLALLKKKGTIVHLGVVLKPLEVERLKGRKNKRPLL